MTSLFTDQRRRTPARGRLVDGEFQAFEDTLGPEALAARRRNLAERARRRAGRAQAGIEHREKIANMSPEEFRREREADAREVAEMLRRSASQLPAGSDQQQALRGQAANQTRRPAPEAEGRAPGGAGDSAGNGQSQSRAEQLATDVLRGRLREMTPEQLNDPAAQQRLVRRIDDRVHFQRGDVVDHHVDSVGRIFHDAGQSTTR